MNATRLNEVFRLARYSRPDATERARMAQQHRAKAVIQLDCDGHQVAEYVSVREASRAMNVSSSLICRCLKGKLKKTAGFIWRYKENAQ
jgi:hypothetical protein